MLKSCNGIWPEIHPTAFVEASAQVIGDVRIGAESSVWFQAVLRGDVHVIRIGARTNVQDGAILHGNSQNGPVIVADDVTIGHGAIVHGCTVHSGCLIGMGAIILDYADIGEQCIIGAGTLITERMIVPPRSMVLGVPGRVTRALTAQEIEQLREQAARYVDYKKAYLKG